MKQVSGKERARCFEQHGWIMLRIKGSHHIYGKAASAVRLSVPVHGNTPLKIGLLRHLLKQAGLSDADVSS